MSRRVEAAAARAEAAKSRLLATADELKAQLSPATLASNAADGVKGKAEEVAADSADFIMRRPGASIAIASGVIVFLARKRIFRRLRQRRARRRAAKALRRAKKHQ